MLAASNANEANGNAMKMEASDREIVITRVFNAPRALVYEAWTKPEHIAKWWGPRGFSITTTKFEFEVGGSWILMMHGPPDANGKRQDFPNHHVFTEIVPNEKVAHRHTGGIDGVRADFEMSVTFKDRGPTQTEVTLRQVYPSKAARDILIEKYGVLEGGKQTLARLAEHLGVVMNDGTVPDLHIVRTFNASRRMVWDAFTKAEHMTKWLSPKGFTTPSARVDLRVGGAYEFTMRAPDGTEYVTQGTINELVPLERLVHTAIIHDDNKAVTTISFAEQPGKTTVEVRQSYSFVSQATSGANVGWNQTLDKLEAHLAASA